MASTIKARGKKPLELSISEAYDMGFCPINQTSQFPFTILNPNISQSIKYEFKCPNEFTVSPSQGLLMANTVNEFRIQFRPNEAKVVVGTVILEAQGLEPKVIRLSAVGKYPYITVNTEELDFGDVLVTKQVSKDIILKNNSQVPAQFRIQTAKGLQEFDDEFYRFSPDRGTVPPKMSYSVKVYFEPRFSEAVSYSEAKIICESGNTSKLQLKGSSKKFKTTLSSSSINFGEVKLDSTLNKVLTIFNNSELATEFEVLTDPNNIFCFNVTRGSIPKNSYKKVIIEFKPRNTVNYYERVHILVRNHSLLFVDLIGTCYDILIKPVPLLQKHIDSFRKRVIEGRISQIELKYIENNIELKLAKREGEKQMVEEDTLGLRSSSNENFYQTSVDVAEHPYVLQKELFLENPRNPLISISEDKLEFGFCELMTLSEAREIEVTNRLQTKLSLFWVNQKRETLNGDYMTVFNVYPETATLKPNVPVKFQVTFRPLKSNTYYFQGLRFYATKTTKVTKKTLEDFEYKELKSSPQTTLLRNIKLNQTLASKVKDTVESTEIFPPLFGNLRCVGHSFTPNSMPFVPIMKVFPSTTLHLKPTQPNTPVYDSFMMCNNSDTPIYFKMGVDLNKVFSFYPKIGIIEPKDFSIVTVQFEPQEYRQYNSAVKIHLNDMPGSNATLNLLGICTAPDLELENEGKVYFSPTSIGVYTSKKYKVRNASKNKVQYCFEVPEKYLDEVHFEPSQKELQPNEAFDVTCYFTPREKRSYKVKVPVTVKETACLLNFNQGYHHPGSGSVEAQQQQQREQSSKQLWVEVNGAGSDGTLQLSEESIDFQTVKITQNRKISFKLANTSDCAFYCDLSIRNMSDSQDASTTQSQLNSVFNLSFKEGNVPANSEIDVTMTFSPTEVVNYNLKLVVSSKEKAPKKISTLKSHNSDPAVKCQMLVKAKGSYPLLQIIDIRNDTLSVAALWENFQIQKINTELNCKLDCEEKKYLSVENLTFTETKNLEDRLKHYEWNLGYVSTKHKAKPRKVIITVKNHGGTPLDYTFKFPSDNKVQEELWADPGEPTEQEAYERDILDKNIFQIRPKNCTLLPGEVKDIELIYSPSSLESSRQTGSLSEVHKLKVVFQIENGKSLVFNLKGTTLGSNEGLITVKKNFFQLPEARIGLVEPIMFPIEINNVGSIKTNYKTEILYEENEYPEVLKIKNAAHYLLPGENLYLYCLYRPLEKKVYNFRVLIHVFDFNKEIQTISLQLQGNMEGNKGKLVKKEEKVIPFVRSMVSEIGSKVFFSIEEINFSKMRANETKYKVILLYNMSKQHTLSFDFPTQNSSTKQGLTCGDKFVIEPSNGNLEPNSFLELKVTLTTTKNPSFYEGQIPCHIVWAQNRFSSEELEMTQKQMNLTNNKESLFLRIKKESVFDEISQKKSIQSFEWGKKNLLDGIFEEIIKSTVNDPEIEELTESLSQEVDGPLLVNMDSNSPASVSLLSKIEFNDEEEKEEEPKRDYSNHEYLLLNEEFKEVTEIIMENTFFNIIQETTHQENDLLRVGKKFVQADQI